jgi:hypothetical protein
MHRSPDSHCLWLVKVLRRKPATLQLKLPLLLPETHNFVLEAGRRSNARPAFVYTFVRDQIPGK